MSCSRRFVILDLIVADMLRIIENIFLFHFGKYLPYQKPFCMNVVDLREVFF